MKKRGARNHVAVASLAGPQIISEDYSATITPPPPLCIWCIWLGPAKYTKYTTGRWPHARQPKEQARAWHCIADQ